MVFLLVHVVAPLAVATYLAVAFERGGPWRLWRDAALLTAALTGFALWQPQVEFYHRGPFDGEWVDTWPFFPLGALIVAAMVHVLSRPNVPMVLRVPPAALLASLTICLGHWIA